MKKLQLIFATAIFFFATQVTFANGLADPEAKTAKKTTSFVETVKEVNNTTFHFQTPELNLQSIQELTSISNLLFLIENPNVNGFNYNPKTNTFSIDCKPDTDLDTSVVSQKLTDILNQTKQ